MGDEDWHEQLVDSAKAAIDAVFGDRDVGRQTTRDSLDDLASHIEAMLEALDVDEEGDDAEADDGR